FVGRSEVLGDLECAGFEADDADVTVRGALVVHADLRARDSKVEVAGSLSARTVDVDRSLKVSGPVAAEEIEVGGVLEGGSTLSARDVSVGGRFRLAGKLTAQKVEAGGSV